MNKWEIIHRRWLTGVDAVTGKSLTFNLDNVAVLREGRTNNTFHVVVSGGLEYEVKGSYEKALEVMGFTKEDANP